MSEPGIGSARDGPILRLTIDQPARLNALRSTMWRQLADALAEADSDLDLRVVVIEGAGDRAFSVGADVSEFDDVRGDRAAAQAYAGLCHSTTRAIRTCRHPVIAAIRGYCVGGGLEIAAACDVRLAHAGSRFGVPIKRLGLPADLSELATFLRIASPATLMDLLLDGRLIGADEALRLGLVSHVWDETVWRDRVEAYLASVAEGAPLVARAHKAMLAALTDTPVPPAARAAEAASFDLFDSEDYAIGRAAFAARVAPRFVGR